LQNKKHLTETKIDDIIKTEREVEVMYYVCNDEGIVGEFASFREAEEFLEMRDDGDMWISVDED
jgi:hypothetical protein